MRLAAGVHELGEELRVARMNAVDDRLPRRGMDGVGDTGLEEVSLAGLVIDVETFGDQQTESALGEPLVIAADPIGRHTLGCRADSRHRC